MFAGQEDQEERIWLTCWKMLFQVHEHVTVAGSSWCMQGIERKNGSSVAGAKSWSSGCTFARQCGVS